MKINPLILCLFAQMAYGSTRLEKLIETTEPRVVKIGIVTEKGGGVCSGAIIRPDGLVLTCAHCFEHGAIRKIFIKTSDGIAYWATLRSIDENHDLALVEMRWRDGTFPFIMPGKKHSRNLPYFTLGSEPIRGEQVVSFGSPLGIQHCATVGYVSNILKREILYILHTAFINPGNSGGPLVNMNGELVGVNEAMLKMDFFQLAHGMYMAISVDEVKAFLKREGL